MAIHVLVQAFPNRGGLTGSKRVFSGPPFFFTSVQQNATDGA
jgi:hypothetical protein